ncbi:putative exported protein of unknown function [Methylobacterium radiotolerans JCM 2831]|uniref:Uncharacterized protein n=1 Tax=Methylobacterium radiotolerans (strain ATCC 27329 / DSM 1819 / JCM 2831 / NBRC 15690 / NCIMB 10815 / 0-1) TaxID=426355 RepID=B1M704_METRJ|nr:putative exported protein of unknown function [Methylobacterium radiotolerans JCM 2831]
MYFGLMYISYPVMIPGLTQAIAQSSDHVSDPEEIYVARSLRLTRIKPTDYCKRAGEDFDPTAEDTYHFLSIATRGSDGRVTSTSVGKIGDLRACYGRTSTPGTSKFFAEGQLSGISFKGAGDCIMMKSISPADGIVPFRCHLEISNLPQGYVGGLLTTNTTNSKIMTGELTDPPGYTMPSIATIRLWRR